MWEALYPTFFSGLKTIIDNYVSLVLGNYDAASQQRRNKLNVVMKEYYIRRMG
jgi:hypothetical protein